MKIMTNGGKNCPDEDKDDLHGKQEAAELKNLLKTKNLH